ncbi:MAG: head maturation protease, ClpP-related [Cetobacterium sp.]
MAKILQLMNKNKKGELKNSGRLEIKNQTENSADLFFYGDIVSSSWESWWEDEAKCPQDITDFLKEVENTQDLNIYINSGGGSVFAGIAIYNLLKRHPGNKTVHVDGLAASIASVIAMAGDKIVIPSNAQLMIHKPSCYSAGNSEDFRKTADILDNAQKAITAIYMENVKEGVTEDQITELINNESWFVGSEAANYFDIEVEEQSELVACTSEYFNKYKNTPEKLLEHEFGAEDIINKVLIELENKEKAKQELEALKVENIKNVILEDLDLI